MRFTDPRLSYATWRMVLLEAGQYEIQLFSNRSRRTPNLVPSPPGCANCLRDPNRNTNQDISSSCSKPSVSRDRSFLICFVLNFHETNFKNRADIVHYAVILWWRIKAYLCVLELLSLGKQSWYFENDMSIWSLFTGFYYCDTIKAP